MKMVDALTLFLTFALLVSIGSLVTVLFIQTVAE